MSERIITLLVINPNSSQSVTDGLKSVLQPPPSVILEFYTAPSNAPDSIMDLTTGVLSGAVCFEHMKSKELLDRYDGYLVCCCKDPHDDFNDQT